MCGRFTLTVTDSNQLVEAFSLGSPPPADLPPRFNIAPTQPVAAIIQNADSHQNELVLMRWGLIPSWAKDMTIGSKTINARSETLATKPMFRTPLARRRCLIAADGFFEWQQTEHGKTPMYITLSDAAERPFGFAGLWERWTEPESGDVLTTCTIITGSPNELVAQIHNRMPMILPRDLYDDWLNPAETNPEALSSLFKPYPAEKMIAYPVSRRVNVPANDDPSLIERAS
jgi:putative SOS response-associated peptidase YedK